MSDQDKLIAILGNFQAYRSKVYDLWLEGHNFVSLSVNHDISGILR